MRQYSGEGGGGGYFRDFNRPIWKQKVIKFRDSSVLNFILFFKSLKSLKFLDKLEQTKRVFTNYLLRQTGTSEMRI